MSLESKISDLVEAGNELTECYSKKAREIDEKVQSVASAIYNRLKISREATFFIDAELGDDSGLGSPSEPFKTVEKAIKVSEGLSFVELRLRNAQKHNLGRCTIKTELIKFRSWGETEPNTLREDKPWLKIEGVITSRGGLIFGSYRSSVVLEQANGTSYFQMSSSSNVTIARSCVVLCESNYAFFGDAYSYTAPAKLSLREAEIDTKGGYLCNPCHLHVQGVIGITCVEDIIYRATKQNTPTNFKFREDL